MAHLMAITVGASDGIVTVSTPASARVRAASGVRAGARAGVSISVPGGATVGTSSGVTARV
jgi:hypothetical protein